MGAPYWSYLHQVTGRWSLTGRGVAEAQVGTSTAPSGRLLSDELSIDHMLWEDEAPYARMLYSLDPSGTRLADPYWGLPSDSVEAPATGESTPGGVREPPPAAADEARAGEEAGQGRRSGVAGAEAAGPEARGEETGAGTERGVAGQAVSRLVRYARALGMLLPWPLWLVLVPGLVAGRRRRAELWVTGGLLATSLAIATMVAVDPRTQLFIVPILAYYVARGVRVVGVLADRRTRDGTPAPHELRRGFVRSIVAVVAILVLLGINARRLYLSLSVGSPHHVVAEQNHQVARALAARLPPDAAIMSWHPAIAVQARRDWRVLPFAPFPRIVRYANAIGCETVVLSAYYPARPLVEQLDQRYLILTVPPDAAGGDTWGLEFTDRTETYAFAELTPS